MLKQRVLVFIGTRPEAIKLVPLIAALRNEEAIEVKVCTTGQHRELLDEVLHAFDVRPEFKFHVMVSNQSLEGLTGRLLAEVSSLLTEWRPSVIVVQGDTTTAMVCSLAAFYKQIPVAHVEAGLRSGDMYSPWPEEGNRKIISVLADFHFAPTKRAAEALQREGISADHIFVTGNTVVDALLLARQIVDSRSASKLVAELDEFVGGRRLILATSHRRENFGEKVKDIAGALIDIAQRSDVAVCLPLHPNPNVSNIFKEMLAGHEAIKLLPPLGYLDLVNVLLKSDVVLTDSGGLQEEAPTFGKPVLVMRDTTERPEGVEAGTALLVGADRNAIVGNMFRLLDNRDVYMSMSAAHNPFGDGHASTRIVDILKSNLKST